MAGDGQVVAGVLNKYVNITKGWRDRLFVLVDDKLLYFKLSGKNAVNVQRVLDKYDPSGSGTTLIGAKVYLLQREHRQSQPSGGTLPSPAATYDLKRAKLRESSTESHKFYVDCPGTSSCTVRTETADDRMAWLTALAQQQAGKSARSVMGGATLDLLESGISAPLPGDPTMDPAVADLAKTVHELKEKAGTENPVMQRLVAQLQKNTRTIAQRVSERDKQIQQLMDERRQLQTELVTESQRLDKLPDELGSSRDTSSSQNDEEDECGSVAGSHRSFSPFPAAEHDGDLFYDAREPGRRTTAASTRLLEPTTDAQVPASVSKDAVKPPPAASSALAGPVGAAAKMAWLEAEEDVKRRTALPTPKETQKSVSLWGIIKECIGKDLTRICLPVYFNEPLSALQKVAEEFEYAELLDKAAGFPKASPERLLWLSVFAVSGYSGTFGRTCKPFNPLLGETFEFVDKQRKFRFLSEKVIHHPTVLAVHVEGQGWDVDGDFEVKSKFWGRCIELKPHARIEVKFHDGEIMTWNKVTTTINNLILGKIYIEHSGTMHVSSDCHSKEMQIKFKDSGSVFGGSKRLVSGAMYQQNKEIPGFRLQGVWNESVTVDLASGSVVAWKAAPLPADPTRYNLTQFAIQLNEVTPGLTERLPPTDCRLRPDQAALEEGYFDKANHEKQRLEQKQRKARKEAEEGVPIESRWFQPVKGATRGEALSYKYSGGYWEQRREGTFTGCRDIFGE